MAICCEINIISCMEKMLFRYKYGNTVYIVSLLLLASYLSIFVPFFGVMLPDGTIHYFQLFKVVFGGSETFVSNGYMYSFSFKLNIFLLFYEHFILIALFGSLFSRNSPRNLLFTLVLAIACLVGSFFIGFFIVSVDKGFRYQDLQFGPGYFMQIGFLLLACVALVIMFIRSKIFWNKRLGRA